MGPENVATLLDSLHVQLDKAVSSTLQIQFIWSEKIPMGLQMHSGEGEKN